MTDAKARFTELKTTIVTLTMHIVDYIQQENWEQFELAFNQRLQLLTELSALSSHGLDNQLLMDFFIDYQQHEQIIIDEIDHSAAKIKSILTNLKSVKKYLNVELE